MPDIKNYSDGCAYRVVCRTSSDIDLLYVLRDMPDLKDIGLLYVLRDMPDIKGIPACCAHSEYFSGSTTNLSDVRHTGQRPTRTTTKIMNVPGACSTASCHTGSWCAWHTTFFVRVSVCPLLTARRQLAAILHGRMTDEHGFLRSFFTKDG